MRIDLWYRSGVVFINRRIVPHATKESLLLDYLYRIKEILGKQISGIVLASEYLRSVRLRNAFRMSGREAVYFAAATPAGPAPTMATLFTSCLDSDPIASTLIHVVNAFPWCVDIEIGLKMKVGPQAAEAESRSPQTLPLSINYRWNRVRRLLRILTYHKVSSGTCHVVSRKQYSNMPATRHHDWGCTNRRAASRRSRCG